MSIAQAGVRALPLLFPISRMATALAVVLVFIGIDRAPAQPKKVSPAAAGWSVQSDFQKNDEDERLSKQPRTNLSGAVCAPGTAPFNWCLMVNDEKKYAQFFSIDGTQIVPGQLIRLVAKNAEGADMESATYHDGHVFVAGSHGRSRGKDKPNDGSYTVFRFPVDKATGKPTFEISEKEVVGVESSSRLRDALKNGETIKDFFDKKLAQGGINIEGIAVKGKRMYLGLRGPSVGDHAFILDVDAAAAFTKDQNLDASVKKLKLDANAGIRDLAPVTDGVLVLAGPVNDQEVPPAVYLWKEATGDLTPAGELLLPGKLKDTGAKAEILLVLEDRPKAWRVLVMFDGPENGAPTEYLIER